MTERKKRKPKFNSIIVKFLLAFLLFGSLLVLITVSIQNDLAETTAEELTANQEIQSLTVLEKNLGDGAWKVSDHMLYKGNTAIGDGTQERANIRPFTRTEIETDSFVYSFMDSALADEKILRDSLAQGRELTPFLRVAGSTLDVNGNSIVGTFLDKSISEELEKSDGFAGRSYVEGRLFYCYYRVIRDASGKRVGAVVAGRSIEELLQKTKLSALNSSLAIVVIILYTFFALFLFVIKWNRSIKRMEDYLIDIGTGELPAEPLIIRGGDELEEMADVINEMKLSLAEKERLRNELELARTIQAGLLPDENTAGELSERCRVNGFMKPAKEVGGDLYDFFMIDSDHLGIVIADVSDKGVPAALFMATAKMCIKDNMLLGASPEKVLDRVNNRLIENNKQGMFVTAWIAELDLRNGHMKYAMAGHPFPYIRRGSGDYELLRSARNLVLAGMEDFEYSLDETDLCPGDRVFLYTDGLDEARDINEKFFGQDRIREFLNAHRTDGIRETVIGMKENVDAFAAGREQFDDLTMLMFEYTGGMSHE